MTESTTLDEEAPEGRAARSTQDALGLVVVWCAETPERVGEVAFLPAGTPGEPRVFGRGSARPDDPHPRVAFVRQRPGGTEATPALSVRRLSRVQLVASSYGLDHVLLRNVGRCPLVVDGRNVEVACVPPGGIARLGHQLLLMCVRRPRGIAALPEGYPVGEFGSADGIGIVGESAAIWDLRRQLALVGPRAGHVLLLGASGTGKELAARGLHALSDRKSRPLVARSAATIPESLVDAELFGNTKNYPNPGMADRPGLVG
ncbi:MAG TPA: sigma 54-interacting transcriptional regulator, partial [Polyangiaceae bacterium]|nr:sigma 54-interacting transcriptional regulator [Polyangiaceae bacterium]